MSNFPAPKDSEYPWIGSSETRHAASSGMEYLITHRDQIEVLGGWKTDSKGMRKLIHFAERAVIRLADEETGELQYFVVRAVAAPLDYPEPPSKESVWKNCYDPMGRDELVDFLTEHGTPGEVLILPFLTDTALGWSKKRPPLRNCWKHY